MKSFKSLILLITFLALTITAFAFDKDDGILNGKVINKETLGAVQDAVVKINDTQFRTTTDSYGEFSFTNIKYGTYQVTVSMIGYQPIVKSDVVIFSDKPVELIIEMNQDVITTENIDVEANYFTKNEDVNSSNINFDYEQIRRAPGSNEDISRMIQTAPGVTIGNDQRNDIIIRGGSPFENLIIIDGIEIPNINHFGSQSTTGGAIGFINLKLIREAMVLTGGFPSQFGDRLSGIVDIKFREGSKKKIINNVDLSFAGFGGFFEGPLTKNGSYLFSIRRSYLDLLKNSIQLTAVPNYWDFNLKLNYDLNQDNKLSLIGFSALDKINFNAEDAETVDDLELNTDVNTKVYTLGINYKHLLEKGYMQFVVSNSNSNYNVVVNNKDYTQLEFKNKSNDNETTSKLELNYILSRNIVLNAGTGIKYGVFNNNIYSKADTTPQGYSIPELNFDNKINTLKFFSNINLTTKLLEGKLIANTGLRYDYFNYTNLKHTISPRIGLTYMLAKNTNVNLSYGIFHQTPSSLWLASDERNKNLSSIRCDHYIAGIEQFITPEIKASLEVYEKRYKDYPVSVDKPTYILIDGGSDFGPAFFGHAVSAGDGFVRGIDLSLEKKLSGTGLFSTINYSYSHSGFTALEGGENKGAFDPTNQFTIISGYQVADDWLFGLKFKYLGGRPYTPFDVEKSTQLKRGVYDMSKFNSEKYPDYVRLDLRVDKKFNIGNLALTTYLELQNVLNRKNVYQYFWNDDKNAQGTIYHWSFMPVGGFNLQF